ncbi:MAG: hypothetical protein J4N95_06300 [Chloroflexi bacterium]|nr:hypothetical protein [Chloroflexota bacterium]
MNPKAMLGILVAPVVALGIGAWAEFADLSPALLLAVALPAMTVTLFSVALAFDLRPVLVIAAGAAIGLMTFAITEGLYLSIHYARGGTLDFESIDSQAAMAAALFGIHVGVGTVAGLALGAVGALVAYVAGARRQMLSRAA